MHKHGCGAGNISVKTLAHLNLDFGKISGGPAQYRVPPFPSRFHPERVDGPL